jgi:anthranilate phosphoribosyltransferase
MGIAQYIKHIGRGRHGARALDREQASDLMGQILDGLVTDLEIGAFCIAMRIKGETTEEMAGFLDATHARIQLIEAPLQGHTVVLPSYNGARRLPVLTPLLAGLLAREGIAVVVHGTSTDSSRITSQAVFLEMGIGPLTKPHTAQTGKVTFAPTELLHPGLKRLLEVRQVVGLRNPAHSLVKLMSITTRKALLVSSYTHPEYATSMSSVLKLTGTNSLLLRGTEGEPVADARRLPQIDAYIRGVRILLNEPQTGPLTLLPDLPTNIDAKTTAIYTRAVLDGQLPIPKPLALQVKAVIQALAF